MTKEAGSITEDERAAVREDHDRFGLPDSPMEAALYGQAWRIGVPLDVDTGDPWGEPERGTMTLTLVDRTPTSIARFTITGHAESAGVTLVVKGQYEVDLRDRRLHSSWSRIALVVPDGGSNSYYRVATRLVR